MSDTEPSAGPAPVETAEEFLALVRASELVPAQHLDAVRATLAPWRAAPGPMPEQCRRGIVEGGLLTEWHVRKLLRRAGRSNFFLDAFKLLKPLGQGGMGSVYLAEYTDPDKKTHRVAVKLLPKKLEEKGQYLKRFEQENWVAARLKHENIARAWDDFSEPDKDAPYHYSVMEYIEGEDLDRLVRRTGPLSAQAACEFIQQAAKGLQFAHDEGLVHRDIKPANLMVDAKGHVKILDFGLVQTADDDAHSKKLKSDEQNKSLGTPDYMSPEQALAKKVDHRSDVYSLGCTFYFLLTGRAPFDHVMGEEGGKGTRAVRMESHANKDLVAPSILEKRPHLPAKLVDLVQRMMKKEPAERPQSAQDVDDELFMLLQGYELEECEQREAATAAAGGGPARPSSGLRSNASATGGGTPAARPTTGFAAHSGAPPASRPAGSATASVAPRPGAAAAARQADTPPPSSSARSTGRMPPAPPPVGRVASPEKPTQSREPPRKNPAALRPAGGSAGREPPAHGKDSSQADDKHLLSRTFAGLPLAGWMGAAFVLLVLLVAAVLLFGT